jgi:NAD(P)-dependent dehydrogenase (short-subunit alcohol dehydrogenase family)
MSAASKACPRAGKDADRKMLVAETLKKFGGIHALVSNAAVNPTYGICGT